MPMTFPNEAEVEEILRYLAILHPKTFKDDEKVYRGAAAHGLIRMNSVKRLAKEKQLRSKKKRT